MMFSGYRFMGASQLFELVKDLNKTYKNIIMVAGSDRVAEYEKMLHKYNGKDYQYDSIKVVSAGERDPDADDATGMSATKMRAYAAKGDLEQFKHGLPSTIRDIDAKRLMNDVREGLGLEIIKEQIKIPYNELREKYFQGHIYQVGDKVNNLIGETFEIIKRGTNHLVVKDAAGITSTKWLHEVTQGDQQ
jgi:predicted nucleotidyltransferase